MHRYDFEQWLDAWTRAWAFRDLDAFLALCTRDVLWHRDPFSTPLHGHAAVYAALSEAFEALQTVQFVPMAIAFEDGHGVAKWAARLTPRNGAPMTLDGVLVAEFDETGTCRKLEEWWHAQRD